MSTLTSEEQFKPGDRVIYTRLERPKPTEWPATYVRLQTTAGRAMHIILLDAKPNHPRQVGLRSIRRA